LKFLLRIQVLLQSFFTLVMLINLPSLIHFLLSWLWQTYLKAFHLKAFHLKAFYLKAFHFETFLHFMMKQTYKRERERERERDTHFVAN
jgi:hypothetical protein